MTGRPGTPEASPSAARVLTAIGVGISVPALAYMPFLVSSLTSEGVGVYGLVALVPVAAAGLILLVGRLAPWNPWHARTAAAVVFAGACWLCDCALWGVGLGHSKGG